MYAEDIRSTGHLTSLLPFIIDLLKVSSSKPVDLSKISIDHFNFDQLRSEPYSSEAQVIAAHLYYLCLLYLPNLTRSWWFESRNKVKGSLETFTEKQVRGDEKAYPNHVLIALDNAKAIASCA